MTSDTSAVAPNASGTARYFAYGTLLDQAAMRKIAPSARSCGVFRLDGYQLDFAVCSDPAHAGCTLEPRPGAKTYGLVYELSREDMAALDRAAGIDRALWSHLNVQVDNDQGLVMPAVTYIIPRPSQAWKPTHAYVSPILSGLRTLQAPAEYVSQMQSMIRKAMVPV